MAPPSNPRLQGFLGRSVARDLAAPLLFHERAAFSLAVHRPRHRRVSVARCPTMRRARRPPRSSPGTRPLGPSSRSGAISTLGRCPCTSPPSPQTWPLSRTRYLAPLSAATKRSVGSSGAVPEPRIFMPSSWHHSVGLVCEVPKHERLGSERVPVPVLLVPEL